MGFSPGVVLVLRAAVVQRMRRGVLGKTPGPSPVNATSMLSLGDRGALGAVPTPGGQKRTPRAVGVVP